MTWRRRLNRDERVISWITILTSTVPCQHLPVRLARMAKPAARRLKACFSAPGSAGIASASGLPDWASKELIPPIRTLSLFSGDLGGLDIGFHQAGFHAVEMVEIDKRFAATLDANCGVFGLFGPTVVRCTDVRKYDRKESDASISLWAGPPLSELFGRWPPCGRCLRCLR